MDIKRKVKQRTSKRVLLLIIISIFFIAAGGWHLASSKDIKQITASQLIFGEVQQGDLNISVAAYGVLRSSKLKLLTALTRATVSEIHLKPGALVSKESIIMQLSNPELEQELVNAIQAVETEQANLRKLKLSQESERLVNKSRLLELKTLARLAELKREAESGLLAKGIVSSLNYKRSEEEALQFKEQLLIQEEILQQQHKMHREVVIIQKGIVQQSINKRKNQQRLLDALTVKAGFDGVLQSSPVSLGQSVSQGEKLALLGSTEHLDAYLNVAQAQVEKIQIGQLVTVNIRRDQVEGRVQRIAPAVKEGTVLVEVALIGPLPKSARPELSVDGMIDIDVLSDALYIERPVNSQPYQTGRYFKVSGEYAKAVSLSFGVETGRYIQILSGAEFKDNLILSDTSRFQDSDEIYLN